VPDARDAVIVPNPIDPDEVRPLARVRAPTDQLVVGYLGGEEVAKGILVLAEIAERLDGAPVRLVVVTKERPRDRNPLAVNDALDRLRALRTFVEFYRRDHDVRNIYAQIDALLVPSLRESFCRVAAEAMANGLPVVASDLPALRELIGADESGLLFPTGNAQAAAHAVGRLAHNRELRSTLARAGERRVAAFTPDRVAGQFLQLYGLDAMVL
jgi:glycosyltransferase involved in cell wall biosynthesis